MNEGKIPRINIICVGDSGVGKSCFLDKLKGSEFKEYNVSTIGLEHWAVFVEIERQDLSTVLVDLWDTSGQEKFARITKLQFRQAKGIILMYDVTDNTSFQNCCRWISEIDDTLTRGEVAIMLVGSKTDKRGAEGGVSSQEGLKYANEIAAKFFEISNVTGENVVKMFVDCVERTCDIAKVSQQAEQPQTSANLESKQRKQANPPSQPKSGGCC